MILADALTVNQLGHLYYPNLTGAIILLMIAPLVALLSVWVNVLISSRVSDVRTATQLGSLVAVPFAGIYVGLEIGLIVLNIENLLLMAAVVLIIDLALFFLTRAAFRREEILTKWK